jgi:hypothetical protein
LETKIQLIGGEKETGRSILILRLFVSLIPFTILLCGPVKPRAETAIGNDLISVKAIGTKGIWIGFSLNARKSGGYVPITEVRFGSLRNIVARCLSVRKGEGWRSLIFSGLVSNQTPSLWPDSYIQVRVDRGSPYPEVYFRLRLRAFDPALWESRIGRVPFHFLACSKPGAKVFHQRGWMIGTPVIDRYILLDSGPTNFVQGKWGKGWSYAPPFGAYPLPIVGLWDPESGKYIGYEFISSRLTDRSELYIASSYCWELKGKGTGKEAREFFCLVFPYASGGYRDLRYPSGGETIASHFHILWSTDMTEMKDPNRFVQEWMWREYWDKLPSSPRMNEFGWLPRNLRLASFPKPWLGDLYGTIGEGDPFQKPGNIEAWGVHYDMPYIRYQVVAGRTDLVNKLKDQLSWLIKNATREKIGDEECIFWMKPIKGDWHEHYGKGVPTLRNVNGFMVAQAFLDAVRSGIAKEEAKDYIEILDGVVRWAKHIIYTRNCYNDVPDAQFAWSAAPITHFLLGYHYAFLRDPDPKRRKLAEDAYELAHSMIYRYLPIFPCDNDPSDNIDSSFFLEPNSGSFWLGAACANEIWAVAHALLETYVATGDPILGHYLRGMNERWHILMRDEVHKGIEDYVGAFSEQFGLFDGTPVGRGKRSKFGGLWGGFEQLSYPVGDSVMRVVCGERAAMAFNKEGISYDISDYRFAMDMDGRPALSFRTISISGRVEDEISITVTVPHFEIDKPEERLVVMRSGEKIQPRFELFPERPDTILVRGIKVGDEIVLGELPAGTEPLPCATVKPRDLRPSLSYPGFFIQNMASFCNEEFSGNWKDKGSFAGLVPGEIWIFGVPFFIVDPSLSGGVVSSRGVWIPVGRKARYIFALISNVGKGARMDVAFEDGGNESIPLRGLVPAIVAHPPIYKWILWMAAIPVGEKGARSIRMIKVEDASLFALTLGTGSAARTLSYMERRKKEWEDEMEEIRRLEAIADALAPMAGRMAVLPFVPPLGPSENEFLTRLRRVGASEFFHVLSPQELVDEDVFNAEDFPMAFYLGDERFFYNVSGNGDGIEAVRRYLKDGGLLVLLPSQPFPFYYDEKGRTIGNAMAVGLPIEGGWEKPPAGLSLHFRPNPDLQILKGIPTAIPFPKEGDPRWRPVKKPEGKEISYIPILTLYDDSGRSYGDGAAFLEYRGGDLAGGRILYAWHTLWMWGARSAVLERIIRFAVEEVRRKPPISRTVCIRADGPIEIDGSLGERGWSHAPELKLNDIFGRDSPKTVAKVLWDDRYLYIAFLCEDTDIWATKRGRDDFLWEEEVVEVFVDPDGDGMNYAEFEVNPLGAELDLLIPDPKAVDPARDSTWNCKGWISAVGVHGTVENRGDLDSQWVVEMAIPLEEILKLSRNPSDNPLGSSWKVNLCRIERPKEGGPLMLSWSGCISRFHEPERFGVIKFIGNPYHETFDIYPEGSDGRPTWNPMAGRWRISGGSYLGEDGGTDGYIAVGSKIGFATWTDYEISMEFQVLEFGEDWRDGVWIGFRFTDPGNSYSLNLYRGQGGVVHLHKAFGGRSTDDSNPLATARWVPDVSLHFELRILAKGDEIQAWINGSKLFGIVDSGMAGMPPIRKGAVVISPRKWSGSRGHTRIRILRFEVRPQPTPAETRG